jgi:diguanylate cyclase (GGDEF)-like protein/PAS domain S-box-containing protein
MEISSRRQAGATPWWRLWFGWVWLGLLVAPVDAGAREVRVGVYENEPKLLSGARGEPSGILGDLLTRIAEREGWTLVPVPCEWNACLGLLEAGRIDLLPDVAYSTERAARMDFHRIPALHSWSQVYQGSGTPVETMLDLEGRRVAVLAGSIQHVYLAEQFENFGVSVQWVAVDSFGDGFQRVARGEADVAVANHRFGDLAALRLRLRATPVMFQPVRLYYAAPPGTNADLLARIDHRLEIWQRTPRSPYFEVLARWGEGSPVPLLPRWVWWGLLLLGAALLSVLVYNMSLRLQVAARTGDLKASEARLATILNSVDAYIYIKDPELRYQYVNRKVCDLFDRSEEEVLGHTDAAFFDADTTRQLMENDRRVLEKGEKVTTEEVNRTADGRHANTFLSVKLPLRDAEGGIQALCGISTDITEQKRVLEEIHQLAFYDPLTGLPNRRLLIEQVRHALAARARSGDEGALLFIDLDNFKNLNDTLGHDMGDQLLVQIAGRLRNHVREEDSLARLGGDEFVVMLEGMEGPADEAVHQVRQVGQKLLNLLEEPYLLGDRPYNITASIGVALFSDSEDTVDEVLKRADLAMYEAKGAGRNALRFFNPSMQAQATERAALEADLREALKAEEFLVYLQPQFAHDGRMVGAEALLRWPHSRRGMVPPIHFIPVAEATGLMHALGDWVLREACQLLVQWSTDPRLASLVLAVNVSVHQFRHPDFVPRLLALLEETGANPRRLELELTESQLVDDVEAVIRIMGQLRERGVRFSLDDFGTGYSSLGYLKRLPLDQLKIDQSFVRDLLMDPNDEAIVRTIVALGESLDLRVIAEGVETEAQRNALLGMGCRFFQGYLLGRPAPASRLAAPDPSIAGGPRV